MDSRLAQGVIVAVAASFLAGCASVTIPETATEQTKPTAEAKGSGSAEDSPDNGQNSGKNSGGASSGDKSEGKKPKPRTVTVTVDAPGDGGSKGSSGSRGGASSGGNGGTSAGGGSGGKNDAPLVGSNGEDPAHAQPGGGSQGHIIKFGPDLRGLIKPTSKNKASFPVNDYNRVATKSGSASSVVPDWMGSGQTVANNRTEFSVDGMQLAIGVRKAAFLNKKSGLASRQESWLGAIGADVTYSKVTKRGFVVSGVYQDMIFYEVFEIQGKQEFYGSWVYPKKVKKEMDPVIVRFFKSFKA